MAAAVLYMSLGMPSNVNRTALQLRALFSDLDTSPERAFRGSLLAFATGIGPLLCIVVLAGSAAVLLQTGFLLNVQALQPDVERLDPRRGLKRLFGPDNLVEAVKAVLKLGVLAWAASSAMASLWPSLAEAPLWTLETLLDRIGRGFVHIALLVVGAQTCIALLDYGWTRWRFSQRLRMSREDLRQETREADGDPRVKARLRQLRQARARRRMVAAVAKATVVVTNPTHYAVALAYERGGTAAPRVVAKGVDEAAARIRAAAERSGVPLVANPPLARALHALPLDSEVPAEHFKVVAEVIAYVWRLRGAAMRDR
jgi:flagellar biosynthetic protein FlhB